MPRTITTFKTDDHHILLWILVTLPSGRKRGLTGILDTGAPYTEFSDKFLNSVGLIDSTNDHVPIKHGLQTQKYGKIILPSMEICGQTLDNHTVYVSNFESSWGIRALVGLDFFRRFRTTIDYKRGQIVTE
jgi:hypothetical protein